MYTEARYLQLALQWVRLRLEVLVGVADATAEQQAAIADLRADMTQHEQCATPPAVAILAHRFDLSAFEYETLLLCAAIEFDPQIALLCARVSINHNQPHATFALAFALFDAPNWESISPLRPLRYWHLVYLADSSPQALTTSPLRIDERILHFIKGYNYLDQRLQPLLSLSTNDTSSSALPLSQRSTVNNAVEYLNNHSNGMTPLVQLIGLDPQSNQLVAQHIAARLGLTVYSVPIGLLPTNPSELSFVARLYQRESLLLPIALLIDTRDTTGSTRTVMESLDRLLVEAYGLFFIDSRESAWRFSRPTLDLEVQRPTHIEQQTAWENTLGKHHHDFAGQLAGQFNLSLPTIQHIYQTVCAKVSAKHPHFAIQVWEECLRRTRPRLDMLAQRLNVNTTWDDLVLPEDVIDKLRQIAGQVYYRGLVYNDWGVAKRTSRGLGIVVLFSGESGTGKTTAAEAIANEIQLNLYRIDLSAVVSKYVGETEKNLRQLFDAVEDGGAILFFDEADALFGKRTQVKDSHDRYANIETNYLLQRLESYRGLAIMATNKLSNMDDAFTRRLRFIVNFPFPDAPARKQIWQRIFPQDTPVSVLDYDKLSEYKLSGGSIFNVAINAIFLAAAGEGSVTMPDVMRSINAELMKSGRLPDSRSMS